MIKLKDNVTLEDLIFDLIKYNNELYEEYYNFFLNGENIRKFERNEDKKMQMSIFDF